MHVLELVGAKGSSEMKGNSKKIKAVLGMCGIVLGLTGCSSELGNYLLREKPGKAMEKYMEEKYGEDFVVISTTVDDSFEVFWKKKHWSGKMNCQQLQGEEIAVTASVTEDKKNYTFYDDYQRLYHLPKLNEILEQSAKKYFPAGNNSIKALPSEIMDDETVPMLTFQEYMKLGHNYNIYVTIENMENDEVIGILQKLQQDLANENMKECDWFVYNNSNLILFKKYDGDWKVKN